MTSNIELFFNTIDNGIKYMSEYTDKNYLELLVLSLENLAYNEINSIFDEEQSKYLSKHYEILHDVNFNVEEIRKALEFLTLKAFKEIDMSNIQTPNVLGLFICYLINRLNKDKKNLNILDPLVGTGNLLFTINNNLEIETNLYGVDASKEMIKLTQASSEVLNAEIQLLLQDTLSVSLNNMDFVIFDTLNYKMHDDKFFPYELIKHHKDSLVEDGYIIAITLGDFFNQDKPLKEKEEIFKGLAVIGVFELPEDLFLGKSKSIIILKKSDVKLEKSLVVKLPSFNDLESFNETLSGIENWIKINI